MSKIATFTATYVSPTSTVALTLTGPKRAMSELLVDKVRHLLPGETLTITRES